MAQATEIIDVFIKPMKRLFPRPPQISEAEESLVIGEYLEALKPFAKASLESGWRNIRETYTGRQWPAIAVCIKACASAQRDFREHRQTTTGIKPESGRMVGGEWQPWSGCNCERCRSNRQARQAESVALFGEPKPAPAYLQRRADESQTEYRRRVVTILEMPIPIPVRNAREDEMQCR